MAEYKTIIFDLDGTLLDSLEDLRDSVNTILRRHGYPERSLEEIRRLVGNGAQKLICRALPEGSSEEEIRERLAEYSDYYLLHSRIKTRPYKEIPELLAELAKRGIRVGVVSNKGEETVKELCESYFPGCIAAAVGDREGFRRKPAPDNIRRAMELLGAEAETVLYVGDSEVDIETAGNCGLKSVLVSWGFRERELLLAKGAQVVIDRPLELLDWI